MATREEILAAIERKRAAAGGAPSVSAGPSREDILAAIERKRAQQAPAQAAAPQQPPPTFEQEKSIGDRLFGGAEALATIGSGIVAEPVSGLLGLGAAGINALPDFLTGGQEIDVTKVIEGVQQGLTFQPRGQAGQEALQTVAGIAEPIGTALKSTEDFLGDTAFELTGSPAIAAAAKTAPTAILEALGLGVLKKFKKGTQLIDESGAPTRALQTALNKEGLVFENLTDAAKAQIPDVADPGLIRSTGKKGAAEKALVEQIESGGRDNSLAALRVEKGRVKKDKLGEEALNQGFEAGFVQQVKTAKPGSRRGMAEMLSTVEKVKGNFRLGLDVRPVDTVGTAIGNRLGFIRDQANNARSELNTIAKTKLKGQTLDVDAVIDTFGSAMDELKVTQTAGAKGVPDLDFKGSLISKDRTSQRIIKDLRDLMSEGGPPDALRFHDMKKQLDNMIDFRKKSAGGLTDAGRKVLKKVRFQLNQSIRDVNPDYARVNDVLSQSLDTFDGIQDILGKKMDIFEGGSNRALGDISRGMMNNRKQRPLIEDAIKAIDDTAAKFGGAFDDDIKDLAVFARSIEDRFGPVASRGSFKGEIGSAFQEALLSDPVTAGLRAGVKGFGAAAAKVKGQSDFNAFRAMEDLIKRGQKRKPGTALVPRGVQ